MKMNNTVNSTSCLALLMLFSGYSGAQEPEVRKVIPAKQGGKAVPAEVMNEIYQKIKAPFKYGVVLKGSKPGQMVDSPGIFKQRKRIMGRLWGDV